jgi:hypothetical protein
VIDDDAWYVGLFFLGRLRIIDTPAAAAVPDLLLVGRRSPVAWPVARALARS